METIIIRRRWRWIGHVLRKEQDAIPRVAVQWRPEGHRKRGRPKTTWRRTVEAEAAAMGQSWGTLRMLAQDREQWKEFVAALIAHGKKGSNVDQVQARYGECVFTAPLHAHTVTLHNNHMIRDSYTSSSSSRFHWSKQLTRLTRPNARLRLPM
ncbi:hypothetical protein RRG08_010504 [Elysia crispata]|nr:hypothetical protein RRG08_010504 [Elysia crispata]